MNRKARRAQKADQRKQIKQLPDKFEVIPRADYPSAWSENLPEQAWVNKHYLVQLYKEPSTYVPSLMRLSICRVALNNAGHWRDGMTWDELQAIKSELGFGSWYGVEIYPADDQVVNVANFRHLWLMPVPLPIGWVK